MQIQTIERLVNLLDPASNVFLNTDYEEAAAAVASGEVDKVNAIDGQFAIVTKTGNIVRMARSIGRPLRYFLAKQAEGPLLIVAERMEEIRDHLEAEGYGDQFHPSYTRMVPAHHVLELALVGCPDPNPTLTRFFTPVRNRLSTDLDEIGGAYIGALAEECNRWLDRIDANNAGVAGAGALRSPGAPGLPDGPAPATQPASSADAKEPIGVLFSGGIDSGAVLLVLYDLLLKRGESPSRLKAFTLSVRSQADDSSSDESNGKPRSSSDAQQARDFLQQLDLEMLLEVIDVPRDAVDYREAVRIIEDYKPLDVQSATMAVALCRGIRERYPDWKHLVDGDGGDENLKDYPIEDNPELTIRSVLNNPLLYHEGWGVDAVKHSLTYSGGQSRGHVRTYAPAAKFGFHGFSPFALPNVIAVSEGIPFIDLTDWDHGKLYALKGEVVRRGVEAVTGLSMPVFEKRRFQHGAADEAAFAALFPADESAYRNVFAEVY